MTEFTRLQAGVSAVVLAMALLLAKEASAHPKGLYKTRAEAEQHARTLGCKGAHLNNGLWLPCTDEAALHRELREE